MFKEGNTVLCVGDKVPLLHGTCWQVSDVKLGGRQTIIYAKPLCSAAIKLAGHWRAFSFFENELVLATPLIKELV